MNKIKGYYWDECAGEVFEVECDVPDGATVRQTLILMDDSVNEACEEACEMGTYDRKVRQVGDVAVLDAKFGHDKITRLYFGPGARALAEEELDEYIGVC